MPAKSPHAAYELYFLTMKMRIFRMGKRLLGLYLLYVLVSILIPPLFHKAAGPNLSPSPGDAGAERVCCVDDNVDALLWRLRLIDTARERIVLSTFDLRDDQSGRDIMAALLNAAERGVNVQVIVDGVIGAVNLTGRSDFCAFAASPNIEVKLYNPISLLKPWRLNYRLHDKYLIADDCAYILGGRNTCDLFLGDYVDTYNIDRDIVTFVQAPGENTSLSQLQEYFSRVWELRCSRSVKARQTKRVYEARQGLIRHGSMLRERYPDAYGPFDWEAATVPARSIRLLSNGPEAKNKEPRLWADLCSLMKRGSSILIQTPYIVCNRTMYGDLAEICGAAGDVRLMTNAPEGGANPFGCSDYLLQKGRVSRCGIELAEWLGGQSLHTKTILIDDSISVVGSCNMDMRSAYLDTELMLVIDCPELNRELREKFDRMAEQSILVLPDGSESLGARCEAPEGAALKLMGYCVFGLLLQPFRYLV